MENPQPGQPPRPQVQPVQSGESNGMALAAMIIGLIAVLLALIPIIGFISWILAPLAIVFGLIGKNSPTGGGFAWTGIISGGVALLICVAWLMLWWGVVNFGEEVARDYESQVRAAQSANEASK
ncbi:hypothetical protein [Parasphingopyxis lamellibrachiae]|uniref:DUF4190 domain-containing protein n=1 Tax=Parasphingopyxis lamellibrachiae TaxID=680125 RepID=A0A3D9FES2_9SPHN|nr:hypothetical protein [Parasphingopyxis lamellibrachiae]RED16062.1 hypothetical protein DFR46_1073 [Parasphingopyxis lamellibrachiae]